VRKADVDQRVAALELPSRADLGVLATGPVGQFGVTGAAVRQERKPEPVVNGSASLFETEGMVKSKAVAPSVTDIEPFRAGAENTRPDRGQDTAPVTEVLPVDLAQLTPEVLAALARYREVFFAPSPPATIPVAAKVVSKPASQPNPAKEQWRRRLQREKDLYQSPGLQEPAWRD
jgi:hypothetical protein